MNLPEPNPKNNKLRGVVVLHQNLLLLTAISIITVIQAVVVGTQKNRHRHTKITSASTRGENLPCY